MKQPRGVSTIFLLKGVGALKGKNRVVFGVRVSYTRVASCLVSVALSGMLSLEIDVHIAKITRRHKQECESTKFPRTTCAS